MGFFGINPTSTKCKQCGTEIGDKTRLQRHIEKAHKKNYETCRKCGSLFHTNEELRIHKKKCK